MYITLFFLRLDLPATASCDDAQITFACHDACVCFRVLCLQTPALEVPCPTRGRKQRPFPLRHRNPKPCHRKHLLVRTLDQIPRLRSSTDVRALRGSLDLREHFKALLLSTLRWTGRETHHLQPNMPSVEKETSHLNDEEDVDCYKTFELTLLALFYTVLTGLYLTASTILQFAFVALVTATMLIVECKKCFFHKTSSSL